MRRFQFLVLAATLFVAGAFSLSNANAQCAANSGANSARSSSWVGGGQAGYNWQQGAFVYGLETDLSATGLNSSMTGGLTGTCAGASASTNATIDWYGTGRGRLGWSAGQWLFYGTGGLAYGHVGLNSTFTALGVGGLSTTSQNSSIRTGWVGGGGIEYLLQPNLLLSINYQYVDLGSVNLASSVTAAPNSVSQTASARASFQVVSAGVSWRFAATNGPGAFGGFYIGGHGGSAWGDSASATYTAANSDARLKRDIVLVARRDDGLGIYQYRYLWSDTVYVGVMAQEVALIHPDAIVRGGLDDYLRVDYSRLGMQMMTLPEWQARNKAASL